MCGRYFLRLTLTATPPFCGWIKWRPHTDCDNFVVRPDLLVTTEATANVCDADSRWYNDLSATYAQDTWNVTAGIKNIADETPPLIARSAGSNRMNRVTSSGYEQYGRQFFLMFNKAW